MLTIPDPEHTSGGETQVKITDLDSDKVTRRSTRRFQMPSFRTRAFMNLAIILGIALLSAVVLVSVLHVPKAARITLPPIHFNYPVSLSVVDGICYTTAPNGVVTAVRVADGSLLWRHASRKASEESVTVVDGIAFLAPLVPPGSNDPSVTIDALRASNGSPLWSRTLPTHSPESFQFTIANGIVYVESEADTINALRASDGSSLWHYISRSSIVSLLSLADGVVYVGTQDGHLSALRASDGFPLWTHTLETPSPLSPIVVDGSLYLSLQDGGLEVLRADTGALLWRYRPNIPALQLYPLPLVMNGDVYVLTQDGHIYAMRSSNGFIAWRVTLQSTNFLPPMFGTGGVVYVGAVDGNIDAIRASDGSMIWHHQGENEGSASIMIAQGVIYLAFYASSGVNNITSIVTLRASDGRVLWKYTPHVPARQLSPVEAEGLVLISMQDGSINALSASSGVLRWHRTENS